MSPNAQELLDALLAPWNRSDAPGLTVGVAKGGRVLYRRGFGMASLESAVANSPRTRMRIGSTSKHFTCLLALLLAEERRLDIEAPIRTYLPELTGPAGEPTLRQLMQHRGGSRCYLDLAFIAHGMNVTPAAYALEMQVRQQGRNFAPGEAMIYNNGGYHLLSLAIERAGGAPFEEQLHDRLFCPLGLHDTTSVSSDYEITRGMAALHLPHGEGRWRRGLFPVERLLGEGGIVSTVDDMLRWLAHLRSQDRFGSFATWQDLLTPPVPATPDGASRSYGLGLMFESYRGLPIVHHAGGVIGGSSQMIMVPEHGLDIVILSNGAPDAAPERLAEKIIDIVLADRIGDSVATVATRNHESLLGDWWSPETGMVYSLVDQKGALQLQICKSPISVVPLVRTADGRAMTMEHSIGAIEVGVDAASEREITITFAGRRAKYQRIGSDPAMWAGLGASAAGEYYSSDCDATARVFSDGERVQVRLADEHGRVEANVIAGGPGIAVTGSTATPPEIVGWCVLNFVERAGVVTGFRLNTARTRNLEFERIGAAPTGMNDHIGPISGLLKP